MNNFQDSIPMLLYRALDTLMPQFRQVFKQFNLTEPQWRVLRVLWEKDAQPLLALAQATLIPSPSLVGVVDRLQRDGLVTRIRSDTDRRVVHICATDKAKQLAAQVEPQVSQIYAQLNKKLGSSDLSQLRESLQQLGDIKFD